MTCARVPAVWLLALPRNERASWSGCPPLEGGTRPRDRAAILEPQRRRRRHPRGRFAVLHADRRRRTVLAGGSPAILLRPQELGQDPREASPRDSTRTTSSFCSRRRPGVPAQSNRRRISSCLERKLERARARRRRQGPRRDRRRRQLRQLAAPGPRVLQGRRRRQVRARLDAREPRRVSHP